MTSRVSSLPQLVYPALQLKIKLIQDQALLLIKHLQVPVLQHDLSFLLTQGCSLHAFKNKIVMQRLYSPGMDLFMRVKKVREDGQVEVRPIGGKATLVVCAQTLWLADPLDTHPPGLIGLSHLRQAASLRLDYQLPISLVADQLASSLLPHGVSLLSQPHLRSESHQVKFIQAGQLQVVDFHGADMSFLQKMHSCFSNTLRLSCWWVVHDSQMDMAQLRKLIESDPNVSTPTFRSIDCLNSLDLQILMDDLRQQSPQTVLFICDLPTKAKMVHLLAKENSVAWRWSHQSESPQQEEQYQKMKSVLQVGLENGLVSCPDLPEEWRHNTLVLSCLLLPSRTQPPLLDLLVNFSLRPDQALCVQLFKVGLSKQECFKAMSLLLIEAFHKHMRHNQAAPTHMVLFRGGKYKKRFCKEQEHLLKVFAKLAEKYQVAPLQLVFLKYKLINNLNMSQPGNLVIRRSPSQVYLRYLGTLQLFQSVGSELSPAVVALLLRLLLLNCDTTPDRNHLPCPACFNHKFSMFLRQVTPLPGQTVLPPLCSFSYL